MPESFDQLLAKVNEIHDLAMAGSVLNWDREVNMPKAGTEARIKQMTTVHKLVHEMSTADEVGELLEAAEADTASADYDSFDASLVREVRRNYDDARKLPSEFVARVTETSGQAHQAWVAARENDDFESYSPWLEQIIGLAQEMAELYGYEDEPYDALLDRFERDTLTATVRSTFDALKAATVPLLDDISASAVDVDDAPLHQPFDVEAQEEFARYAAEAVGYDFDRGHLGTSVHPFSTSFSRYDSRITTRWYPDFLSPSLFGTMHESGHAMYEQGTGPELARTPLARGTSMGFHESQSRMMENMVGRSRGFWSAHYGELRQRFPDQLGNVPLEAFYAAINKVQPSYIRVEADELTYNLHIVLRFELEQDMLNGDLVARDVPEAWNAKSQELLGVTPPTDRDGCLQDVHWTRPSFGYFPTYALGNLYAAQLLEAAKEADPRIAPELHEGQVSALVEWLRENVHRHGKKYPPTELVARATGRELSPDAFVRYARAKFGELYGV
jgi:carboxypeptidase Taq